MITAPLKPAQDVTEVNFNQDNQVNRSSEFDLLQQVDLRQFMQASAAEANEIVEDDTSDETAENISYSLGLLSYATGLFAIAYWVLVAQHFWLIAAGLLAIAFGIKLFLSPLKVFKRAKENKSNDEFFFSIKL
jgi:hypothetical protein